MTYASLNKQYVPFQEPVKEVQPPSLSHFVGTALDRYFSDLGGHTPNNLYRLVVREVEKPLLEIVMQKVRGNQTRAAKMLGINRSTLRKKLQMYHLN